MSNISAKPAASRSPLHRAALPAILALSAVLAASSAFAQGAYQSPSAPNSSQSMPQSPNSTPRGARTLPRGATGIERMGTVGTTRVQPKGPAQDGMTMTSSPRAPVSR